MKKISKQIIIGAFAGGLLFSTVFSGAMSRYATGKLYTKNPIYSPPQGYAYTSGFKRITAKCIVSKKNYAERSISASKYVNGGGSVETEWIKGPTYASAGTKFKSVHTGYDSNGTYEYLTASKSY